MEVPFNSLLKQNIKSWNTKEKVKTTSMIKKRSEKIQLCTYSTLFCTFLCRCFARLQRETSRNFPLTRFIEEMYVFLFTIFFTAAHFPLGAWPVAFLIFSPQLWHFHVFLQTELVSSVVFYFLLLALSLFSTLMLTFEFGRKKDPALLLFLTL